FRRPPPLPALLHFSKRLSQQGQPRRGLPDSSIRVGQQDRGLSHALYPHGLPGLYTLAYLGNALFSLSLLNQASPQREPPPGHPVGKPLLPGKGNDCLCVFLHCPPFAAEAMDRGNELQGKSETERMGQLVGQREGLLSPLERLLRITKMPQDPRRIREAHQPRILAIHEGPSS